MQRLAQHKILVCGDTFDNCCSQLHKYFDLTTLVIYDCIEVREELSTSGLDAAFFQVVTAAESKNRQMVAEFVADLLKSGITQISDLQHVPQGYLSKTVHILSHFLDGFIGIDSYFYNLVDDSHWLPQQTSANIKLARDRYWLIHIDCYSRTPDEAGLLHL